MTNTNKNEVLKILFFLNKEGLKALNQGNYPTPRISTRVWTHSMFGPILLPQIK